MSDVISRLNTPAQKKKRKVGLSPEQSLQLLKVDKNGEKEEMMMIINR